MKPTHIALFVLAVGVSAGFTAAVRGANLTSDAPEAAAVESAPAPESAPEAAASPTPAPPAEAAPSDPHAGHDMSAMAPSEMAPPEKKPAPADKETAKPAEKKPAKPKIAIHPKKKGDLIHLNNERCPIMGGKANPEVFVDVQGLRVNFCCPGCDTSFKEDPKPGFAKMGITDVDAFKRKHGLTK